MAPLTAQPMLQISNVSVRFGEAVAVNDVSLTVAAGEFVSLLGPSGCGKTTLLRSIAGYVFPEPGKVVVNGRDITDLPPQARRIGMVFQNYALFPHLSVGENIGFGMAMQRRSASEIAARVREMLEVVRLPGFEKRRPGQLSGGQQQRVALARALAFEPQLLLLDEPLGALDLQLRESMQLEIKRIQRATGVTTIFVTHDQGEALAMSDRVAVLNAGRIEQVDEPRRLYADPATAFVADFVGRSNVMAAELVANGNEGAEVRLANVDRAVPARCSTIGPGQRGWLSVRPEHVHLGAEGAFFEAAVEGALFLGTHSLVTLRHGSGLRLNAHSTRSWRLGETVGVRWSAENAKFLDS
ncbi:MAG TPA: ABC transporter ATP-binding protein [Hyphomicrobiales bacterium]|nr:ABC transporter ATP-binding protein [Hyphomicrobiales bacterium]